MRRSHKKSSSIRVLWPLLVLALLFPPHTLVGETIDNNNAINDIFTNTLNEGGADALADLAEQNPAFFEEVTAQAPPVPPPNAGRKEKASGAQGAAIFGAVMAFASCAMMMAAARKMEPGPERTMMMAQAMQQCAQGAQNAANAGDNGNAADAVTSGPAQFPDVAKAIPSKLPSSPNERSITRSDNNSSSSPTPSSVDGFQSPSDLSTPEIVVNNDPGRINEDPEFLPVDALDAPRPLPAINHPKIGFNEDLEEDGLGKTAFLTGGSGPRGVLDPGKVPDPSPLENGSAPHRGTLDGLIKDSGNNGVPGGSVGGGSGKLSLNGLLNKFGAKDGGDIGAPPGDIVQLPLDKKSAGGKRLNIFEYGTYRYRRLTYDDGRIRTRLIPTRSVASEPQIQAASVFK